MNITTKARINNTAIGAILLCIAVGVVALAAVILATGEADSHEAIPTAVQPFGWQYGAECCSVRDCFRETDNDIAETKPGYLVNSTGEVIAYADKRIKRSKDEFYHRCTPGGTVAAKPLVCLYVPDRGM